MGFVVGLAAGYVAGTAAGRERFEQIKQVVTKFGETGQGREIRDTVTHLTDEAMTKLNGRRIDLEAPKPVSEISR